MISRSHSGWLRFWGFFRSFVVVVLISFSLTGCAGSFKNLLGGGGDDDNSSSAAGSGMGAKGSAVSPGMAGPDANDPVAKLYNKGLDDLMTGSYKAASKDFAEVNRQHPYSKWATKALLMQAFADYQRGAYDDAINAAKQFISLHPGHKDQGYAYYLVAISEYEQIGSIDRDQQRTLDALEALDEVAKRFPGTAYAADAAKKSLLAKDRLAAKEMEVGRFYVQKSSYLAGINRFKKVITDYQTTSYVPEALYRIAECYMALGVVSEAQTAAAVLGHNFPNSRWYKDAYNLVVTDGQAPVENKSSWISKLFPRFN